jgi:hypothetical protein
MILAQLILATQPLDAPILPWFAMITIHVLQTLVFQASVHSSRRFAALETCALTTLATQAEIVHTQISQVLALQATNVKLKDVLLHLVRQLNKLILTFERMHFF